MAFQINEKVRITRTVGDSPSGDSPGGVYADAGDVVVIRGIDESFPYPYLVSHENVTNCSFGVNASEIDAILPSDQVLQ